MATNARNKALEVRAWIERMRRNSQNPDRYAIRRYILERWPELDESVRAEIFAGVMAHD